MPETTSLAVEPLGACPRCGCGFLCAGEKAAGGGVCPACARSDAAAPPAPWFALAADEVTAGRAAAELMAVGVPYAARCLADGRRELSVPPAEEHRLRGLVGDIEPKVYVVFIGRVEPVAGEEAAVCKTTVHRLRHRTPEDALLEAAYLRTRGDRLDPDVVTAFGDRVAVDGTSGRRPPTAFNALTTVAEVKAAYAVAVLRADTLVTVLRS